MNKRIRKKQEKQRKQLEMKRRLMCFSMSKAFFGSASERYLYFGCFVMSNLSEKNGRTPRTCKIHLPPSITAISSCVISSLPHCQVMNLILRNRVGKTHHLTTTRLTGRAYRRTQTMNEHPGTDRRRFTLLVNPKIREEQRRQAALRKFIKDCERLYEKNRAHLQEDARNE